MGDPQFIIQEEAFGRDAHASHFAPNGSVSTHRDPIIQINIYTPSDIDEKGTIDPTEEDPRGEPNSKQRSKCFSVDDIEC